LSDERVEFSLTQLGHIDVVCRRQNPAAGTSLDNVGAVFDVEPNCITRIVFGIDDAILRTALMIEHAVSKSSAAVAMPACRTQRVHGDEHSRPGNYAGIDSVA